MTNPKISGEKLQALTNLCEQFAQQAIEDGTSINTLEICQLEARLNYYEQLGQWDNYNDVIKLVDKYLERGLELFVDRGLIWSEDMRVPRSMPEPNGDFDYTWRVYDGEAMFTDIGRKIDINWGGGWNILHGSAPVKNILEEELKNLECKFYENVDQENEDLSKENWKSIVESHLSYFKGVIVKDIMNKHVDVLVNEDAIATGYHAMCEFAKKLSDNKEELRARFRTACYSWVRWFYQEELKRKDTINQATSDQKLKDKRTLNQFLRQFWNELNRTPTLEEIKKGLGWGENRFESTFKLFDFNIGKFRPMNHSEMLYTVMDQHLDERQASILEMNFGLNGTKFTINEIAEEFNVNEKTIRRERAKAMEIIELHLGFKFS